MQYYKLRIDLTAISRNDITDLLNKHSTVYASCIEGFKTDNPHMHFYIETTTKSQALRVQIRKLSSQKGNGSYSLKTTDPNPVEYLAYMMKENKHDFSKLSPKIVAKATKYNEQVKQSMADKKAGKTSVIDKLSKLVEEENLVQDGVMNETGVKLMILRYHKDNRLLVRKFQLQSYYLTLRLRYTPLEEMEDIFI